LKVDYCIYPLDYNISEFLFSLTISAYYWR
jgi:hypothetical protein